MIKINEISPKRKYAPCCTWQEDSDCENCQNKTKLDCKWDLKHLLRFLYALGPALIVTFVGIIVGAVFTGWWWRIGALLGYYTIFFIIETRILCSHCPYYSEDGSIILHCLANHGFIKFYKYHPEPMNRFERTLLIFGIILFGTIPLLGQVPSIVIIYDSLPTYRGIFIALLILLGVSVISVVAGFGYLFTKICPRCVNFSCPFNSVPKDLVDIYLDRNPDMKNAWKEHGYNTDAEQ